MCSFIICIYFFGKLCSNVLSIFQIGHLSSLLDTGTLSAVWFASIFSQSVNLVSILKTISVLHILFPHTSPHLILRVGGGNLPIERRLYLKFSQQKWANADILAIFYSQFSGWECCKRTQGCIIICPRSYSSQRVGWGLKDWLPRPRFMFFSSHRAVLPQESFRLIMITERNGRE